MKKKIIDIFNNTVAQLVFALLAGVGYFMILAGPVVELSRGMWIILLFFAPAIICGSALVIIKLAKQAKENENEASLMKIFWIHVAVFIIGAVLFTAMFI